MNKRERSPVCHIVGAGDFEPSLIPPRGSGDLLIAADAGFLSLQKAGLTPDLYIGDGDSLGFLPRGVDTVVLPKVKDDTDTLAAVREGLSRGYRHFFLYGALGGKRFSHSLANLQTLLFLKAHGAFSEIVDVHCRIFVLPEGETLLDLAGGYFSLFTLQKQATVSVSGAKYPLQNAVLTSDFPLGVSNEGERETRITVHEGEVFLVREV